GEAPEGPAPMLVGWEHLLESEDVMDEEREYLEELMAVGIQIPPEVGEESESGVYLDVSWPQARVAVILEPEDGDVAQAERDGWTVVSAAAATVRSALENARAGGSEDASHDGDGENR